MLEYSLPDRGDFWGTAAGFIEEHLMFDDDDTHIPGAGPPAMCAQRRTGILSAMNFSEKFKKPMTRVHVFAASLALRSRVDEGGRVDAGWS